MGKVSKIQPLSAIQDMQMFLRLIEDSAFRAEVKEYTSELNAALEGFNKRIELVGKADEIVDIQAQTMAAKAEMTAKLLKDQSDFESAMKDKKAATAKILKQLNEAKKLLEINQKDFKVAKRDSEDYLEKNRKGLDEYSAKLLTRENKLQAAQKKLNADSKELTSKFEKLEALIK